MYVDCKIALMVSRFWGKELTNILLVSFILYIVIKGRFIARNPWPFNHIKVFALDSFKEPFVQNKSYDVV